MKISGRTLSKDLVAYGVMGGLSRSVSLLLLPLLTRYFTPSQYGVVDILNTLTALVAIVGSLNLESAVARLWFERASQRREAHLMSSAFLAIMGVGLFSVGGVWVTRRWVSAVLLHDPTMGKYVLLATCAGTLNAAGAIPQIVLRMKRQIVSYNVVVMVQTFLYGLFALVSLVRTSWGLGGVLVGQVLASLASLTVALILVRQHLVAAFSRAELRAGFHYCLPLLPSNAAGWVNGQVDRMVLLGVAGLGLVGVFGAASRLVMVIALLVAIFQQAWTPLAIGMVEDVERRQRFYSSVFRIYVAGMLTLALFMTAVSRELLLVLAPREYVRGYVVIPWLAGAAILQGSGAITSLGMLITKRTGGNSVAAWAGVLTNVVLCVALVPRLGLHGASVGAFAGGFSCTTLLWYFSARSGALKLDAPCFVISLLTFVGSSLGILVMLRQADEGGGGGFLWARLLTALIGATVMCGAAVRRNRLPAGPA